VIAATGFSRGLTELFDDDTIIDAHDEPRALEQTPAADGLWFVGYGEPPGGPLRHFRIQAGAIAAAVAGYLVQPAANRSEPVYA
jgi:hypothetical protein